MEKRFEEFRQAWFTFTHDKTGQWDKIGGGGRVNLVCIQYMVIPVMWLVCTYWRLYSLIDIHMDFIK